MKYILQAECECGELEIEADNLGNYHGTCDKCGSQIVCADPSEFKIKE